MHRLYTTPNPPSRLAIAYVWPYSRFVAYLQLTCPYARRSFGEQGMGHRATAACLLTLIATCGATVRVIDNRIAHEGPSYVAAVAQTVWSDGAGVPVAG